eukprot:Nk52_evm1s2397 gene=Nk52_evmTU1s2397
MEPRSVMERERKSASKREKKTLSELDQVDAKDLKASPHSRTEHSSLKDIACKDNIVALLKKWNNSPEQNSLAGT